MGLDCTHNAFHGAYSAFNQLRQQVCKAFGGSFPPHEDLELLKRIGVENPEEAMKYKYNGNMWYTPDDITRELYLGLYCFLEHEDCEGDISPEMCIKVADDLNKIIDSPILQEDAGQGHIGQQGGYKKVLEKFIAGCRLAASCNESLGFH